jgi:hypothetical protein
VRRGWWLVAARGARGEGLGDPTWMAAAATKHTQDTRASGPTCSAPRRVSGGRRFTAQEMPKLPGEVGAPGTDGQWLMTSSRQALDPHKRGVGEVVFGDDEWSLVRFAGPRSAREREGRLGCGSRNLKRQHKKGPSSRELSQLGGQHNKLTTNLAPQARLPAVSFCRSQQRPQSGALPGPAWPCHWHIH